MNGLLYSFIYVLGLWVHPIHISVTEIEYDEREKELEITTRIFTDDLELAIRAQRNDPALELLKLPAATRLDDLVKPYLLQQINIQLDGKAQKLNYLGHEQDGDAHVFFIQVQPVKKWKSITVQNQVLLETYDDQSNIVHVTVREKTRSMRLIRNNAAGTLTFD
ncbi:MAG: hypothetical protein KF803_07095 [Cyclobacteriaceae bacterium]|nr:hypothetical protein [Cyclobacteriaceae bacterium]